MNIKVIGLTGEKGSGKGEVAAVLRNMGYVELAFADALKEEVAKAFQVSLELLNSRETKETPLDALHLNRCYDLRFYGRAMQYLSEQEKAGRVITGGTKSNSGWTLSPRLVMQLWGTEYRRHNDAHYWVRKLQAQFDAEVEKGETRFVISDVREDFESSWVHRKDLGFMVRIIRPGNPYSNGTDKHSSETLVGILPCHFEIVNNGLISQLAEKTLAMEACLTLETKNARKSR